MTPRSFFSEARIDSYSAMLSRTSRSSSDELVDGELGEAIELQFEDGVDLAIAEGQRSGDQRGGIDAVLRRIELDAGEGLIARR